MTKKPKVPKLLYKYRSFSNQTLDMLVTDQIFFADPNTFNDPLDTRPTLEVDLEVDALKSIFKMLVEQRISAEMSAAAKTIKYRGPKTLSHIAKQSLQRAEQLIADVEYNATNPDYGLDDRGAFLFGVEIEKELLRRYDKGIFALADRVEALSNGCPRHTAEQLSKSQATL